MILRRIIAHLRKQEWTAIAIDFVIVAAASAFAALGNITKGRTDLAMSLS